MSEKIITSVELSAEEVAYLDEVKAESGARSRSAVIRMALIAYEDYRPAAKALVKELKARFDDDAYLAVELNRDLAAVARVDGEEQPDLCVTTKATRLDGEDFVYVALGDGHPTSPVSIRLGWLPRRAGVPLSFPLRELDVDMWPRPVAYFERPA